MGDFIANECTSPQHGFCYIHNTSQGETTSVSHIDKDLFSVFMLLSGELDYVVEGTPLHLTAGDVLLVSNNELHQSIVKEGVKCEYVLLMIHLDFFIKNDCSAFVDMVFHRALGHNNLIPAKKVVESGISDIFRRLDRYTGMRPVNLTVVNSVIIELMYNLNSQVMSSRKNQYKHEKIRDILDYINTHLTEKLSLEIIASHFYINQQYLCRIFKQNTGFTVNKYISYKRIVLVRELCLKGISLAAACEKAGFNDYSAFYRAYSKIMHESPRKSLSKIFP